MLPLFIAASLFTSQAKVKALYNSLDTRSVAQHLAFYENYADTNEGKAALKHAWELLCQGSSPLPSQIPLSTALSATCLESIIHLINKQPSEKTLPISDADLEVLQNLAQNLPNRKLKGRAATSDEEVLSLASEEVDLARGLFLSEVQSGSQTWEQARAYEVTIDLMALQILAKLPANATHEQKIDAINEYIFEDMGFRFPPHSLYAKEIDLYTFLPSVLDSRKGVCLGVSLLYLCLAQRLDLPLEIITPPGHIFVRYENGDKIINIETTARGVHFDDEVYLGIETKSLQRRNMKDAIGLAHFNQASVFWQRKEYEKAIAAYQRAQKYLGDDMLLLELMGYNYILSGDEEKGRELLQSTRFHHSEHSASRETVVEDYLTGKAGKECIETVFMPVDENRESILKKKAGLEEIVQKYPEFRAGLFQLGVAWMQLHRLGEALEVFQAYHRLDPNDPSAEYYLTVLYAERMDFKKAWEHLAYLENLLQKENHAPKVLQEAKQELRRLFPK